MPAMTPEDAGDGASLARSRSEVSQLPGYTEFFVEFYPKLKNYARNQMGPWYADGLAEQTLEIVARHWDHVYSPGRYAFRIMTRLCDKLRSRLEREGMYINERSLDEMREYAADIIIAEWSLRSADDIVMEGEFIREILSVLTIQQAKCFYAKYILGYNSREIAGLLGIEPQTVRVHLTNARRRIVKSLGKIRG